MIFNCTKILFLIIVLSTSTLWAQDSFGSDDSLALDSVLESSGHETIAIVLFPFDSDMITAESDSLLKMVVQTLKSENSALIELAGHTDNYGSSDANKRLAEKRTDAVKNYLVKNGIDDSRISTKNYGMGHPISDNNSLKSRRLNRRVTIWKKYQ